ncbi:hypothetical protein [Nostoc sp.]|uniref:hypothetical protein n=1 Tax=Nostoc sp. TaxID=1180 RepID=UPI002FF4464B
MTTAPLELSSVYEVYPQGIHLFSDNGIRYIGLRVIGVDNLVFPDAINCVSTSGFWVYLNCIDL